MQASHLISLAGNSCVQNDVFTYKLSGSRSWTEPEFASRTLGGRYGYRLDGCFSSTTGGSVGGSIAVAVNTLCFDRDGRFSLGGATSVIGPVGSGSSSSSEVGTYLIDGRSLNLSFDDGNESDRLFSMDFGEDGEIGTILFGGGVLQGP